MKFRVNKSNADGGEVVVFDQSRMTVEEARTLKHHTGFGLRTFGLAMQDGDPDAIVGMLYLAYRRAGKAVQWGDFDQWDLNDMEAIPDDAEKKAIDEQGGGGVDPNPPAEGVAVAPLVT